MEGDWIMHHGSCIMDHGSWIMDHHGSWIMDHGSWIMDHGSWIMDHGSWIMDHGSWIGDGCEWYQHHVEWMSELNEWLSRLQKRWWWWWPWWWWWWWWWVSRATTLTESHTDPHICTHTYIHTWDIIAIVIITITKHREAPSDWYCSRWWYTTNDPSIHSSTRWLTLPLSPIHLQCLYSRCLVLLFFNIITTTITSSTRTLTHVTLTHSHKHPPHTGNGGWLDHGSWIMDHGSWVMDHGSWIMDHGSWIIDHGLVMDVSDTNITLNEWMTLNEWLSRLQKRRWWWPWWWVSRLTTLTESHTDPHKTHTCTLTYMRYHCHHHHHQQTSRSPEWLILQQMMMMMMMIHHQWSIHPSIHPYLSTRWLTLSLSLVVKFANSFEASPEGKVDWPTRQPSVRACRESTLSHTHSLIHLQCRCLLLLFFFIITITSLIDHRLEPWPMSHSLTHSLTHSLLNTHPQGNGGWLDHGSWIMDHGSSWMDVSDTNMTLNEWLSRLEKRPWWWWVSRATTVTESHTQTHTRPTQDPHMHIHTWDIIAIIIIIITKHREAQSDWYCRWWWCTTNETPVIHSSIHRSTRWLTLSLSHSPSMSLPPPLQHHHHHHRIIDRSIINSNLDPCHTHSLTLINTHTHPRQWRVIGSWIMVDHGLLMWMSEWVNELEEEREGYKHASIASNLYTLSLLPPPPYSSSSSSSLSHREHLSNHHHCCCYHHIIFIVVFFFIIIMNSLLLLLMIISSIINHLFIFTIINNINIINYYYYSNTPNYYSSSYSSSFKLSSSSLSLLYYYSLSCSLLHVLFSYLFINNNKLSVVGERHLITCLYSMYSLTISKTKQQQ